MDKVSKKTEKKNKIQALQESISRLESDITMYKSEGNTTAYNAYRKVLKCLESKLQNMKKS
jgi:hypothetical protein